MTMTIGNIAAVKHDKELAQYIRRQLAETGLTQAEAASRIGKSQTWFPNSLFASPGKRLRHLYVNEPETFDILLSTLGLDGERVLTMIEVKQPKERTPDFALPNAHEIDLGRPVPVYPAGAGPALDDVTAVDYVTVPMNNGGSYDLIGLRMHGSSMSPYLEDGEIAVIACEPALVTPGKPAALYLPDEGHVVKVFLRHLGDGSLLLQSLNPGPDEESVLTAPIGSRLVGSVVRRLKQG